MDPEVLGVHLIDRPQLWLTSGVFWEPATDNLLVDDWGALLYIRSIR